MTDDSHIQRKPGRPQLNPEEEAVLVDLCTRGDANSWRRLIDMYGPRVFGAIKYFLRSYRESLPPDDALHIYQEMFMDLCEDDFRKLKTFRAGGRLATWLFTIARRQCLNHIRSISRKKRLQPTLIDREMLEIGQPLAGSSNPLNAAENREAVLKALEQLDYDNRLLLVLFYFENLSYEEIAKVVGVSVNSVSAMMRRAREEIARILES